MLRRAPQEAPGNDSDDGEEKATLWSLTAGEWAKQRWITSTLVTSRVDLLRGYASKIDFKGLLLKLTFAALSLYSIYLLYCESCKDEYYRLGEALLSAATDAATGARGSVSGAMAVLALAAWLATVMLMRRKPTIYLVDFCTYRHADIGGDERNTAGRPVDYERFLEESRLARHLDGQPCFTERSMDFQEKILRTSCIGEGSIFPPSIFRDEVGQDAQNAERDSLCMRGAREEAELMMFNAVQQLLERTGTRPEQVGILVVNCSLFCPTPSLSAMLVNRFGFRADVLAFNLGGMGCSASVIAVDLAARLLRSAEQRNTLAIVVSTENITQNWYRGNDRSMLLSNCLFRCGAAALLLSNARHDARRARFSLSHIVRTHMGKNDECYRSVFQEEDDDGIRGVRLSKQIMQIAGDALKRNITTLGPLVLPASEQLRFFANLVARNAVRGKLPLPKPLRNAVAAAAALVVRLPLVATFVGYRGADADPLLATPPSPSKPSSAGPAAEAADGPPLSPAKPKADPAKSLPPYTPNFTRAFEWICVHTGGRAVIDAIETNLSLPTHYLEPSRLSLYKYGNVSSASIWYELELIAEHGNCCGNQREGGTPPPGGAERRLQRGDRVWQIAFGSGFKCNSAVWKCLRNH